METDCEFCERVGCRSIYNGPKLRWLCGWSGYRRKGDHRPCPRCGISTDLKAFSVRHRSWIRCLRRPGGPMAI